MRRGSSLSITEAERQRRAWLAHVRRIGADAGAERTVAGVHLALAAALGAPPGIGVIEALCGEASAVAPRLIELPATLATPHLLGAVHETLRAPSDRKAAGAVYTDPQVARLVVEWALEDAAIGEPRTVCDPAVGGGVFLLAAAEALHRRGIDRREVVDRLFGCDIDPLAVAVTRAALTLWQADGTPPPGDAIRVADAVEVDLSAWSAAPPHGFDVVVGNPPFRGQHKSSTARTRDEHVRARERFGEAVAAYADSATLFLLLACGLARHGGAVAMLQPESFLAARDAGPVRAAVAERAALRGLWLAGGGLFEAGVRVCVPLLRVGAGTARVELRVGRDAESAGTADGAAVHQEPTWAHLAADAAGVPRVDVRNVAPLADLCAATADFRDEYYGLLPALVDSPNGRSADPPVVTCGLIDPMTCRWGSRPARLGKRTLQAPRASRRVLDERGLGDWARRRLVPKVVVATQTRVIEAAVDEKGAWLPSTPVITITCRPERLWHAAAVLTSPVATVWAHRRYRGVALSSDTLKLSAKQVLEIPLPEEGSAWDAAAAAARRASSATSADGWRAALLDAAAASCEAYGVPADGLVEWWAARLPPWR